ncbi:MAG: TlpA disulfide reductase family protein [Bacteroidota bacterium]
MRTPLPRFAVLVLAVVMYGTGLFAQDITVNLAERVPVYRGATLILWAAGEPDETLNLPAVDTTAASFLKLHYSRDVEGNSVVSALVLPDPAGQVVYVDLNNDEDLTNDGSPLVFPFSQNELTFYLSAGADPLQRTLFSLSRVPRHAYGDSTLTARYVGPEGALSEQYVEFARRTYPGVDGAPNTFFFGTQLTLSQGRLVLNGETYTVGLYDYNQSGRFDDRINEDKPRKADRFMVDLDQSGELNSEVTAESFLLDEVFEIAGTRYTLTDIDPYGRQVTLTRTEKPVTNTYAGLWQDNRERMGQVTTAPMPDGFWDETLTTINGDILPASDLRGRYVLLNFWGEWCSPCLNEMPALSSAREQWPEDEFALVGVLKTYDMDKAMEIVDKRDLDWPHVNVTDAIVEQFAVEGYPTNILILPDGERYIKAEQVSTAFFERNME